MPLSRGARLGLYEIVAPLGAGGMGEVYRARDPKLEREVAIKVLPTESLHDDTARARLVREARLAATLNHPNICTVFEVGEAEGHIYLAMELIEGVPLSEKIAERGTGLPTESVVRYGAQIAAALAHAHERRVIHRDLKSSNVVVTPDGRAKVLDFGVARRAWEEPEQNAATRTTLTEAGTIVGTPHYLAPEVLSGRKADERSDVWALGVLMHEMASASLPFKGGTSFELASAIMHDMPAALPDRLPAGLRAVITRCLAKEPGERYQRVTELRAALEAIGSVESSIGASAASGAIPPAVVATRASRLPWWLAGGAIAAIAVAAGLWFGGAKRTGAPPSGGMTNSLAVLPFVDMSQAKDQEYFSDGLAEELLNVLAKIHNVKVVGRTSSFSFKGKNEDLRSIGKKLGVANILEGSVRKSGDRIRITAQLVKTADGFHLWSETYDRKLDDVFAVQDDIASAVAAALQVKLLHPNANPGVSRPEAEAYDLVLQARFALSSNPTPESIARAGTILDRALQLAPNYAPAWAERGLQHLRIGETAPTLESAQQASAAARKALQRAIELDSRLALAHSRLANIELAAWNFADAERSIARALELDPTNNLVRLNAARVFANLGRIEEAMVLQSAIAESDPLHALNFTNLGSNELMLNRLEPAELHIRKALDLAPDFVGFLNLGMIQVQKRDFPAARESFSRVVELSGMGDYVRLLTTAVVESSAGNEPASRTAMREFERRFGASASSMAEIHAWRGEADAAFAALDRALAAHDPALGSLHTDILLRPLHGDPRWKDLLRKVGLPTRQSP